MADKPDTKTAVTFKELLMSNTYAQEALVNLLEQKGILTKKELLEEIQRLRDKASKETRPDPDVWIVSGRVTNKEGKGLPGLTVTIFDEDLIFDELLGEVITDDDGCFLLAYRADDFRDLEEENPDLYLVVKDTEGNVLYNSDEAVRLNAGHREDFQIRIRG